MKKILDVGCGRGAKIAQLQKRGCVTGIDISAEFIDNCQQLYPKSKFFVMNALSMSLKAHTFDEVYCMDVIEHVDNPNLLLKNISKILKPDGKLFLDIPYFNSEKLLAVFNPTYFSQVHHKTVFSFNEIIRLLNKYSFKIDNCQFIKSFDNIYLLSFFIKGKKIQNQQGDLPQKNNIDKLMSYIVQHTYINEPIEQFSKSSEYLKYDQISKKYFHLSLVELLELSKLSNQLFSPILPKTISLVCHIQNNPNNNISKLKPQNKYGDLSKYSFNSKLKKHIKTINKLSEENNNLKKELTKIKDSKLYKLWPIYNRIKKLLKK